MESRSDPDFRYRAVARTWSPGRHESLSCRTCGAFSRSRRSWAEALKTLNALEVASSQPGNETASQQLAAPLAFYRGVCEANLGHPEKAQVDFEAFLALQPITNSLQHPLS